jgi:hypothetical protein
VPTSRWPEHMACCGDGRGRPGIHACERGGPEKCRASAICAHDQAPGKPPDDRRDSNTWPGCGPTWGASHDIPADRRWEPVTKFLLPAPHEAQAHGVLAVMLVPTLWRIQAPTPLAQAQTQTRTPTAVSLMMTTAHGRVHFPRDSPGRNARTFLLGRNSKTISSQSMLV